MQIGKDEGFLCQMGVIPPFFLKKIFYLFIFREGKGGRKKGRETSMCDCPSSTRCRGPGPQPRHVPWLGIKPATLWFTVQRSIHWATPARGPPLSYQTDLKGDNSFGWWEERRATFSWLLEMEWKEILGTAVAPSGKGFACCPAVERDNLRKTQALLKGLPLAQAFKTHGNRQLFSHFQNYVLKV